MFDQMGNAATQSRQQRQVREADFETWKQRVADELTRPTDQKNQQGYPGFGWEPHEVANIDEESWTRMFYDVDSMNRPYRAAAKDGTPYMAGPAAKAFDRKRGWVRSISSRLSNYDLSQIDKQQLGRYCNKLFHEQRLLAGQATEAIIEHFGLANGQPENGVSPSNNFQPTDVGKGAPDGQERQRHAEAQQRSDNEYLNVGTASKDIADRKADARWELDQRLKLIVEMIGDITELANLEPIRKRAHQDIDAAVRKDVINRETARGLKSAITKQAGHRRNEIANSEHMTRKDFERIFIESLASMSDEHTANDVEAWRQELENLVIKAHNDGLVDDNERDPYFDMANHHAEHRIAMLTSTDEHDEPLDQYENHVVAHEATSEEGDLDI